MSRNHHAAPPSGASHPRPITEAGAGALPALSVEVIVEDEGWYGCDGLPDRGRLEAEIERAARAAFAVAHGQTGEARRAAVAVLLGNDARLCALNRRFRGKDRPTNVLSFPAASAGPAGRAGPAREASASGEGEHFEMLGDIALARETIMREAREGGVVPAHHLQHLVIHGMLHLLGYDHERSSDAARMEARECAALAKLGLECPYNHVEALAEP